MFRTGSTSKSFEYEKCLKTGKTSKSLDYGKCLETGKQQNPLNMKKCLETGKTAKFTHTHSRGAPTDLLDV